MGEPLANLGAVLAAVHIMCHPKGLQLSHKKVTTPQHQQAYARDGMHALKAVALVSALVARWKRH
jgi:adenine C2-methylase RlmN of 23S rRNA A2503 and tRNA A37